MAKNIDKLIINSPYEEPKQHWSYDRENRNFNIKRKAYNSYCMRKGSDSVQSAHQKEVELIGLIVNRTP